MNTNNDIEFRRQVLLTCQVALLGMITPTLRGVTVKWSPNSIHGVFLYDGEVTEVEKEIASDVEGEVIAAFPNQSVKMEARSYPKPAILNEATLNAWVFMRME